MSDLDRFVATVPLPSRDLSPNSSRRHQWRSRTRAVKRGRREAWYWLQRAMPVDWKPCSVRIDVIYHCPRSAQGYMPRDTMNAIAAMKPMVDAMVDVGIIPDDSAKWLSWGNFQLTRTENGMAPGVRITVTKKNAPANHGDVARRREQHHERIEAVEPGSQGVPT